MPLSEFEQNANEFPPARLDLHRAVRRETAIGYGWALGMVALATIMSYLIIAEWHLLTLAPLMAVIVIMACYGGIGPTIVCGVLGSLAWLAVIAVDWSKMGTAHGHGIPWRWEDAPARFIQFSAIAIFISASYFARRRAESLLRRAQQRLAAVLDESQIGTWTYEVSAGRFQLSPRMEAILGPRDGATPPLAAFLDSIPMEDRPIVSGAMKAALEKQMNYEVEHRVIRADGSTRRIVMRGKPLIGRAGKVERIIGVGMEATEGESAVAPTPAA